MRPWYSLCGPSSPSTAESSGRGSRPAMSDGLSRSADRSWRHVQDQANVPRVNGQPPSALLVQSRFAASLAPHGFLNLHPRGGSAQVPVLSDSWGGQNGHEGRDDLPGSEEHPFAARSTTTNRLDRLTTCPLSWSALRSLPSQHSRGGVVYLRDRRCVWSGHGSGAGAPGRVARSRCRQRQRCGDRAPWRTGCSRS